MVTISKHLVLSCAFGAAPAPTNAEFSDSVMDDGDADKTSLESRFMNKKFTEI